MPEHSDNVAFIGGGVMAEAMISSLIRSQTLPPEAIAVSDPSEDRRHALSTQYRVAAFDNNLDASAHAESGVLVLAVKPQHASVVFHELQSKIGEQTVVLSIMAGLRIDALCRELEHPLVVRSIPNTPAQVGASATVWVASATVEERHRAMVRRILAAIGLELEVGKEELVEAATGLTAPTPAFVFMIVEALAEVGVALGFTHSQAVELIVQTLLGSVELMKETGEHAAVLRSKVTSPGGATAAGLYVLEKAGIRAAMADAVHAVLDRSRELGPPRQDG